MYHYVREHNDKLPYFKYLHIDNFFKQLDYFGDKYVFINKDEFCQYFTPHQSRLSNTISPASKELENKIILTFDDGLKDHYKYVFPELKKRKIWGIFYVPFKPYIDNKILDVHRIHLLLGKYKAKRILSAIKNVLDESMLSHSHIDEYHSETYGHQKNDPDTNYVKRLLNYFIDYKYREGVIDQLMLIFFPDEKCMVHDFYMTTDELKVLHNAGMMLGSHTVNHPVMSKLKSSEQEIEIQQSFEMLEQITGVSERTFAYPYGGFHSFNREKEDLLANHNSIFSFNVESRDISLNDINHREQALPRYDCNEFPYGTVE